MTELDRLPRVAATLTPDGKFAFLTCPHCGRRHWHEAGDFRTPRIANCDVRAAYFIVPQKAKAA